MTGDMEFTMYAIGDRIVHPMHGAGVVEDIVTKRINGTAREYYIFRAPGAKIMVMIPLESCEEIGVRPVVDERSAQRVLEEFPILKTDPQVNWNKRYRDNMLRIKSGNLTEVSRVVKGLMLRERKKALSTGERRMLNAARQILLSELVFATGRTESQLSTVLDEMIPAESENEG